MRLNKIVPRKNQASTSTYLELRDLGWLGMSKQITLLTVLFVIYTLYQYYEFTKTGEFLSGYPLAVSLLLAPIYEEIIFRAAIFGGLQRYYSVKKSAVISCLLFGIWHLKNIFYLDAWFQGYQIIYAACIIGPVLTYLTWRTRSIWPGAIVHYLNNIIAPFTWTALNYILVHYV